MLRFFYILFFLFSLLNNTLYAQCGVRYQNELLFPVKVQKDIQYGEAVNNKNQLQALYLDFYEPEQDTVNLRPILIFLHGGSFLGGNKNLQETTALCKNLAQRGYAVAAVNYRTEENYLTLVLSELMVKATIRALHDAKASIRYIYKQAKEDGNPLRIDTNQIFLGGLSAGAIAALHTAYLDNDNEGDIFLQKYIQEMGGLEGESGHAGYSTKIRGVVNLAGCMLWKELVNNNKNIPLLNVQYQYDPLLPSYYGRPYNIFTLPIMAGLGVIAKQMDLMGIYNVNHWIPGRGHVPYEKDSKFNQELLNKTGSYVASFMFSLLECNPARVNLEKIVPIEIHELSIYPNPSQGIFILGEQKFDVRQIRYFRIIDLMGRKVYEERVTEFYYIFDVSHLPIKNNLYIVEVLDAKHQVLAQQKIFVSK